MNLIISGGVITVIDDDDFDLVRGYTWRLLKRRRNGAVYVQTSSSTNGKRWTLLMHRLILGVKDSAIQVDHIDGDGLNNKRENLRVCSRRENLRNVSIKTNNKSGHKGVWLEMASNGERKWRASVTLDGVKHRKWFDSKEEAIVWSVNKRKELHGAFAVDNR